MDKDFAFQSLKAEDRMMFDNIIMGNSLYNMLIDSDLTFNNMFIWSACDKASKCVFEDGVIVKFITADGEVAFYPPFVKDTKDFVPYIKLIEEYCLKANIPLLISCVAQPMADLFNLANPTSMAIKNVEENNEYVYNAQDLISLKGKAYHSKRNHCNAFRATYDHEFVSYDASMKSEIMKLVEKWSDGKTQSYLCEYTAIDNALTHINDLSIFCDVIKVDGVIAAFAIGFTNPANVGVVMHEKADNDYKGIYAAINNYVAAKHFSNCTFMNRQEDLGIEGLKRAKQSYNPVTYAYKYQIRAKSNE